MIKNYDDLTFEELHSLYGVLTEFCSDYSRMTDRYSLATGDKEFENMPLETQQMINERQQFFSYREKVREEIKKRIISYMEPIQNR